MLIDLGFNEKVVFDTPDGRVTMVYVGNSWQGEPRLGFDAPKEIPIHRKEVLDRATRRAKP